MEKNVMSYLGITPKANIGNCGGCTQKKVANCSGAKVGNCGGCVANATGSEDPETMANEAKTMGMTLEQYQKYLEAKGETQKASKLSTWLKDGTIANVVNQGASIFKSFSSMFAKTPATDPTTTAVANPATHKEEDKSAELWNGLPVWAWVVMGIIVLPILIYITKIFVGKAS